MGMELQGAASVAEVWVDESTIDSCQKLEELAHGADPPLQAIC